MTSEKNNSLSERDARYVLRPWSGTGEPVPIVSGTGCTVTDADGKEFLDFTSGYFVNQAGHSHPKVVAAAHEQAQLVTQVSGRHTTPALVNLAEKLVQITPKSLDKVFFSTSGTEANEFALKLVRQKTGKPDLASLENAYHGLTLGVLGGCAAKKYRETAGVPLPEQFTRLPMAYCYRCPYANNCEVQCLDGVDETLAKNAQISSLIAEPIQAVGGLIPPESWWARMETLRKKHGLLLILDEIQTGAGRTGVMFAAEHYGLEPDIITGGKGLSGGIGSLGVTMVSDEVGEGFYAGTTPTSGGNAVSAASGFALLNVIESEGMVENAAKMGVYFTEAVNALNDPWVGDVRFKGLLGGVELVSDRENKTVLDKPLVIKVKNELHENGMLLTVTGPHGNCLRLQPSLCITSKQLDQFVSELSKALRKIRNAA